MRVVLRSIDDGLIAFGEVEVGDGYDGTPILEWDARYFTGTGIVTLEGYRVYVERRVRSVVADPVWKVAAVTKGQERL